MRPHPHQTRIVAACCAAATLILASCGGSDSSTTADQKSVTVYSGRAEALVGPILEKFTEETGIKVDLRPGDSGELAAQIVTEGNASPADVFFSQDAGALGAVEKAGLFEELPTSIVDKVPAEYRSKTDEWVGVSGRARVFVYNPTKVLNPPTSIDALLAPEWKGRLGFAPTNASFQAFVTGLRVLRGENGARTWLEGFVANEPKAYENNAAVRDAVNDGDIDLGLVNHYYLYEAIAEKGADAVVARNQFLPNGDPGGLVNVAGVGILKTAEHHDAAEKLTEFLLGDEAQTYFADETYEYPLVDGVSTADGVPPLDSLNPPKVDLADLDSIAKTQELLADVGLLTK